MPVEMLAEKCSCALCIRNRKWNRSDFESRMPYNMYPITGDDEQNELTAKQLMDEVGNIWDEVRRAGYAIRPQITLQFACLGTMEMMLCSVETLFSQSFFRGGLYSTPAERIRLSIDTLNALFGIREAFHVPLDDFATLCPIYYRSEAAALGSQPRRMVSSAARYPTAKQRTSAPRAPVLVRAKRVHLLPQRVRGGKKILPGRYLYLA